LETQSTRPPRKILHLTAEGREAFERWTQSPVEHGRDFRLEFLSKLYFASEDGTRAVDVLVSRQHAACRGWLADLERQLHDGAPDRPFERLVLQFRSSQLEAILSWLDTCRETLAPGTSS